MNEKIKQIIKSSDRYKDFTLLPSPMPFKELFEDQTSDCIQLHDMHFCGDDDIVGFCGQCKWENNQLTPLDGDTYYDDMLVYGYSWFENKEENVLSGLDILVSDW